MVLSVRRTAGFEVFSMEGEASDLRNVDSRAGNPLYIRNMYIYIHIHTYMQYMYMYGNPQFMRAFKAITKLVVRSPLLFFLVHFGEPVKQNLIYKITLSTLPLFSFPAAFFWSQPSLIGPMGIQSIHRKHRKNRRSWKKLRGFVMSTTKTSPLSKRRRFFLFGADVG